MKKYLLLIIALMPCVALAKTTISTNTNVLTDSSLIGWWTMDGKDTNWATGIEKDKSGNGNNGQLLNMSTSTSPVQGKIGQALSFNAVSSNINLQNLTNWNLASTSFTISAWIKYRTRANSNRIIDRFTGGTPGAGFVMYLNADGTVAVDYRSTGTSAYMSSSVSIATSTWTHVLWTMQNGNLTGTSTIYINGVQSGGSTIYSGYLIDYNVPLHIGLSAFASNAFDGYIDDVRIYNRALSTSEINNLYNLGKSTTRTNANASTGSSLVGWWTMDGKDTNWTTGIEADKSGNGFTGQLFNFSTSTSPTAGRIGQALIFNNSPYIKTGLNTALGDFTACAFFKTFPGNTGNARIVDKNYVTGFWLGRNGASANSWGGGIEQNLSPYGIYVTLQDGFWHQLCMSRAGTLQTVTGDGGSVVATSTVSSSAIDTTALYMGQSYAGGSVFNGIIDDVRVYNRALSTTEIQQLYNSNKVTTQTNINVLTDSSLIGWWTMDGKDTNWATGMEKDKSGNGNNAQIIGLSTTTGPTAGRLGQAMMFQGSTTMNYLNAGATANMNGLTKYSVSVWVYMTRNHPNGSYCQSSGNSFVQRGASSDVNGYLGIGQIYTTQLLVWDTNDIITGAHTNLYSSVIPSYNVWHHVVGVDDASSTQIWLDGVNVASTTFNGSKPLETGATQGTRSFNIGACFYSTQSVPQFSMYGKIDDVRFYNRALSPTEIQMLYQL